MTVMVIAASLAWHTETSIYDVSPPPETLITPFHSSKAEQTPARLSLYTSSTPLRLH